MGKLIVVFIYETATCQTQVITIIKNEEFQTSFSEASNSGSENQKI